MVIARAGQQIRVKEQIWENSILNKAIGEERKITNIHSKVQAELRSTRKNRLGQAGDIIQGVDPIVSPADKCMQGKWSFLEAMSPISREPSRC